MDALSHPFAVWLLAGSYLCGSIPFGYLLARTIAKQDVRDAGSGNIGATNVARVVGKKLGIVTLILDALKGASPVLVTGALLSPEPTELLSAAAGMMAFLGHCFPVWLRFRGGKGVATGLGVMLVLLPVETAIGLGVFVLVFLLTKWVSAGSIAGAFGAFVSVLALQPRDIALAPVAVMFAVLLFRHRSNLQRIIRREEFQL